MILQTFNDQKYYKGIKAEVILKSGKTEIIEIAQVDFEYNEIIDMAEYAYSYHDIIRFIEE